jgi:hypothetical protein
MAARSWKRALTLLDGLELPEAREISARLTGIIPCRH